MASKNEYTELYLKWIRYLKEKKIYGCWIKDVSFFYCKLSDYNNIFLFRNDSFAIYTNAKKISDTMFNTSNRRNFKEAIRKLNLDLKFYNLFPSKVNWLAIFKEFENNIPQPLSKKLSRKIYRSTNKMPKTYRPKEEQIWYNKSYEKYNTHRWKV